VEQFWPDNVGTPWNFGAGSTVQCSIRRWLIASQLDDRSRWGSIVAHESFYSGSKCKNCFCEMFQTVNTFINTLDRYLCHHGVLLECKLRLSDAVG
jgi:hypothetical protein